MPKRQEAPGPIGRHQNNALSWTQTYSYGQDGVFYYANDSGYREGRNKDGAGYCGLELGAGAHLFHRSPRLFYNLYRPLGVLRLQSLFRRVPEPMHWRFLTFYPSLVLHYDQFLSFAHSCTCSNFAFKGRSEGSRDRQTGDSQRFLH